MPALLLSAALLFVPQDGEAWRKDLDELVKGLAEKHTNAFFKIKREDFEAAAAALRKRLPELKDFQIAVEFMKLAASIGDGHTGVRPANFGRYPIALVWLKDGLHVVAVADTHKDLLKARIKAVGDTPVEEAARRVTAVVASDNASGVRHASAYWLTIPAVLSGVGLIDDPGKATFTIVDASGKERKVDLAPVSGRVRRLFGFDKADAEMPISRRLARPRHGSELLAERRTLYGWYDACVETRDRPVAKWCEDVLKRVDDAKPERIVLDLRRNGGGNSALIQPLIDGLRERPEATGRGKLFVLVDRGTYSSAILNALDFRREFNAVLIGLPPGGSPNHFGEVRTFKLPHCGWQVQYSTKYFKRTKDEGDTIKPDVEIDWTATEFFGGQDPALEAALQYKP